MKKSNYLILIFSVIAFNSSAQNLICQDFKAGKFYIPTENENETKFTVIKKDSSETISQEFTEKRDSVEKYVVIRKESTQVEWRNGINIGEPLNEKIEWINKCSYRLTYDECKTKLTEQQQMVNDYNGIVVEMISIKGNCMKYKATMILDDGYEIAQNGTICKNPDL